MCITIFEVITLSEEWIQDYNHYHPHGSLGGYSPVGYRHAVESGKLAARKCAAEFTTCHSSFNNNNNDQVTF